MYELIQLSERTYYIKSPTNIGLVKLDDKNVCLIDSGNDKDAGRKIRQLLDANGWNLTAIYNTHSNADHIGGNRYLQNQTGCKIYAPGIDCAFTRHPVLEPSFLYGGFPPKDLRCKFLLAQESDAQELTEQNLPDGFEIIKLPGIFLIWSDSARVMTWFFLPTAFQAGKFWTNIRLDLSTMSPPICRRSKW